MPKTALAVIVVGLVVAGTAYGIPADQVDLVTLQVELNTFEHDPAVFSGSVA